MRLPLRMPFSLDAAFTSVAASALVVLIEIARVWKLTNEILRPAWYGVRSMPWSLALRPLRRILVAAGGEKPPPRFSWRTISTVLFFL